MLNNDIANTLLAIKFTSLINERWPTIENEIGSLIESKNCSNQASLSSFYAGLLEVCSRHSIDLTNSDLALEEGNPLLAQYLTIHFYISQKKIAPESKEGIRSFVEDHQRLKAILKHWRDEAKVIIYLDCFGKCEWADFVRSCTWNWTEITLLDESLPYCNINLEVLCDYLRSVITHHPTDGGINRLTRNVISKIKSDNKLKQAVEQKIEMIIASDKLSFFLPSFLIAIIDTPEEFGKCLLSFKKLYDLSTPYKILYALGAACPDDAASYQLFKAEALFCLAEGAVVRSEVILLYAIKNFKTEDIQAFLIEVSQTTSTEEDRSALLDFLRNNVEVEHHSHWFRTILRNIVVHELPKDKYKLDHLLYQLVEKDIDFTYELISLRFEKLGADNFFPDHWKHLIEIDRELFSTKLT